MHSNKPANGIHNGKNIPGAVVTPDALEIFNYKCRNVYFYSLNDSVKTSDYATVYKKILIYICFLCNIHIFINNNALPVGKIIYNIVCIMSHIILW